LQYPDPLPRSIGFVVRLRRQHLCDSGGRDNGVRAGTRRRGGRRLSRWRGSWLLSRRRSWLLSRRRPRLLWRPRLLRRRLWLLRRGSPLLVECLRRPRLQVVIRFDRRLVG